MTIADSSLSDTPWLLRRLNQRFRDAIRRELDAKGHHDLPQQGVWAVSALAGGVTEATVLVGEMGVTKQAVSKLVETLVSSGYVVRRPNEEDRRRTTLALTPRGRRAAAAIQAGVARTDEALAAEVGQRDFSAFMESLGGLAGLTAAIVDAQ
jgi:DNA-binding MarR family transcriptional regulator